MLAIVAAAHPAWAEPAPATPQIAEAPPPQSANDEGTLQEVTVTARHRQENLQSVPIAITALTGDQLEANPGQQDLKEIEAQLPSVQIEGYSGRNQTITIRGLGTNAGSTNDGLEQGVGLYIDGIYYARTGTAIEDLSNIASIAELRGPQGTLFGKNTVAGAIDIQTKEASFTFGGYAQITFGNYGFVNAQANVTGPITDELAGELTLNRTYRDGDIYNTTYHDHWDNRDDESIRAELVFKPDEDFKYRLGFDYDQQIGDIGFLTATAVLPTTLANGKSVAGFYTKAGYVDYTPIPIEPFSRQTDINSSQYDKMPSGGFTGRGDWQLGDLTLNSITGYRAYEWLPNFDADYTGASIYTEGIVITHQQQFSQEFRVTSPTGQDIEFTSGLYYWFQKNDDLSVTTYGADAAKWFFGPTSNPAYLNNLTSAAHIQPITDSYAGYGQATWHITPELSLTGGFRYTYEVKQGIYDGWQQGDPTPISALPAAEQAKAVILRNAYAPVSAYSVHTDDGEPSGTVNLSYNVTPDVLSYATYSRGYKSAGINLVNLTPGITVLVQPEQVDDYELGAKTTLLDHRVTLNANLFWTTDDNFQTNVITAYEGRFVGYIGNVPEVQTRGVELDAAAEPLPGLKTTLSAIYDDATYVTYPNAVCPFQLSYKTSCDLSGKPLAGTPRWSASLSAEYDHAFDGADGLLGYIGGDWHVQSSQYSAVNDDPYSKIAGYGIAALHVGVRTESGLNAEFWVRNLLDKNYYNTLAIASTEGLVVGSYGEPRMFGFTLRKTF